MKNFFKKLSDIKNAIRVLEIMDKCECDIWQDNGVDTWIIKPKHSVSKKEAEDLRNIILYKEHYCKRSKLWKIIFPDFIDGCRFNW